MKLGVITCFKFWEAVLSPSIFPTLWWKTLQYIYTHPFNSEYHLPEADSQRHSSCPLFWWSMGRTTKWRFYWWEQLQRTESRRSWGLCFLYSKKELKNYESRSDNSYQITNNSYSATTGASVANSNFNQMHNFCSSFLFISLLFYLLIYLSIFIFIIFYLSLYINCDFAKHFNLDIRDTLINWTQVRKK